jgi:hypothetical protein
MNNVMKKIEEKEKMATNLLVMDYGSIIWSRIYL